MLYTEGKHVHPKRPDVVSQISELMFERMRCPRTVQAADMA